MSHGAWGASFVAVVMSFYTEILVEMLLGTGAPLDAFFLVLSVMLVWILMERSLKQIVSDISTEAAETKRLLSVQTVGGGGTIPEYQYYQYELIKQELKVTNTKALKKSLGDALNNIGNIINDLLL